MNYSKYRKSADDWSRQILKDIERRQKADKQEKSESEIDKANQLIEHMGVGARYNKTEDWQPKAEWNLTMSDIRNHRNLPKSFVFNADLSLSAKAVYPVMCCLADFKKNEPFQRSQETISRMVGLSVPTVKKALDELEQAELITKQKHEADRRVWLYTVDFIRKADIPEWEGEYFRFQRCIIDTGLWSKLTLRQQVFYLGLRAVGKADPDLNEEIMHRVKQFDRDIPYKRWYAWRRYDVWAGSRRKLLDQIGIQPINIKRDVIEPLEQKALVHQLTSNYWSAFKVFIRPNDLLCGVAEYLKEEILLYEPHNHAI